MGIDIDCKNLYQADNLIMILLSLITNVMFVILFKPVCETQTISIFCYINNCYSQLSTKLLG